MPWKDRTIMEQKIKFICEWRSDKYTITELCKQFVISRPTTYKLIARFEEKGYDGPLDFSRNPRSPHLNQTNHKMVNTILKLKEQQRHLNQFTKEYNHVRPHEAS